MPRMGTEPTIPVFERAKTVHDLHRPATVIGQTFKYGTKIQNLARKICDLYAVWNAKGKHSAALL
jgi:hypothetical protein